jgi:tetratricopeptide (TPR) repeat protein
MKAFRPWIIFLNLIFIQSAIFPWTGCSKGPLLKRPDIIKTWSCDNSADEAMKRQDYEAAISLHDRILENQPENALAQYHLGYIYGQTEDHLKEVSYYENALSLGFRSGQFFYNLGMAYGELNEIEKSVNAFKKALEIDPDSADYHFGLAMAYDKSGIADKSAEKEFLKAIKIDSKFVDARLYLSMLYADWGELHKAAEQLRKILEIDPGNVQVLKFLERIEYE